MYNGVGEATTTNAQALGQATGPTPCADHSMSMQERPPGRTKKPMTRNASVIPKPTLCNTHSSIAALTAMIAKLPFHLDRLLRQALGPRWATLARVSETAASTSAPNTPARWYSQNVRMCAK